MRRAQAAVDYMAQQRLVEAGLERFALDGYPVTSVRQIAADARCSIAVFYQHFRSKQALLLEIIDATYTAAIAQVEAAVALAPHTCTDRLEAAVWAQRDFGMRHQRACRVAEAEFDHLDVEDRRRLSEKRVRAGEIISEILGESVGVKERGAISRELVSRRAATGLWYGAGARQTDRLAPVPERRGA
jgi:AcrR family transcriptional regulator